MVEKGLLGLGKYQKEQSHEFKWTYSLFWWGKGSHVSAGQKDPHLKKL